MFPDRYLIQTFPLFNNRKNEIRLIKVEMWKPSAKTETIEYWFSWTVMNINHNCIANFGYYSYESQKRMSLNGVNTVCIHHRYNCPSFHKNPKTPWMIQEGKGHNWFNVSLCVIHIHKKTKDYILSIFDNRSFSNKTRKTPNNVDHPGTGGWFQPNQLVSMSFNTD